MSFFKKVGGFLKKAAPIAGLAATFIPGASGLISGALGKLGSAFGIGGGVSQAPGAVASPGPDGVQRLPEMTVTPSTDWSKWAGALGSVASAGLNYYGARQANVASADQAQRQMDFQRDMSSSSYQRGVVDMKAAGLNPMLAYSQGGASAPGGAMAPVQNELGAGANSALSALTTIQGLENASTSADLTRAETARTLAGVALTEAQTGQSGATARAADAAAQHTLAQIPGAQADSTVKGRTTESRVAQAKAESQISQHGVPEAAAAAKFYQNAVGENSGFLPSAARAASVIRSIIGR